MRKILLLATIYFLSCGIKQDMLVFQLKDEIFVVDETKMYQFGKGFHPDRSFKKQKNNIFCGSSLNLNCIDNNRNSYNICFEIVPFNTSKFKILSTDTCVERYFELNENELTLISNDEMHITWDSIVITYKDFPNKKTKIINSEKDKSELIPFHPLTLTQEVYFIVNKNFGLIISETTNENTIVLSIFSDGKLIRSIEGNIFPKILHHINSKLE